MTLPIEVAVYAEYSPATKPMQPGWNTRVFNKKEIEVGTGIRLGIDGTVMLAPGIYHITASSIVTYNDNDGSGTVLTKLRPYAGYCRLRHAKDDARTTPNEKAVAVGTIATANMAPSLIETYLKCDAETELILEHQVGDDVKDLFLQIYVVNSPWHIFARIAIRRL